MSFAAQKTKDIYLTKLIAYGSTTNEEYYLRGAIAWNIRSYTSYTAYYQTAVHETLSHLLIFNNN